MPKIVLFAAKTKIVRKFWKETKIGTDRKIDNATLQEGSGGKCYKTFHGFIIPGSIFTPT